MRLSPEQAETIRNTAHKYFGDDARIWLFGSRTDHSVRGGDIDSLVEPRTILPNPFAATIHLKLDLQNALGDQRVEIPMSEPDKEKTPKHRIAYSSGIPL